MAYFTPSGSASSGGGSGNGTPGVLGENINNIRQEILVEAGAELIITDPATVSIEDNAPGRQMQITASSIVEFK